MEIKATYLKLILSIIIGYTMSSCSFFQHVDKALPDYRVDYNKSETIAPLEIPPDLLATDIEEALVVPEGEAILPMMVESPFAMQIKRAGGIRWLEIAKPVNEIWPKVRAFWQTEGFTLTREDLEVGILETEWKENRADLPQDGLRKLLGEVLDSLYATSTRDKFRTRLEPGQSAETTTLYLTHRGAEEVSHANNFVWQSRPTDPELEAEMLRRLMLFMGANETQPAEVLAESELKAQATLQRTTNGQLYLLLTEDFDHAWQRVGLAIDRLGFSVIDRNRGQGTYLIHFIDPEKNIGEGKSFWAGWFGTDEETAVHTYIISLLDEQAHTQIFVGNKAEQADDKVVSHILSLLEAQLK